MCIEQVEGGKWFVATITRCWSMKVGLFYELNALCQVQNACADSN